MQVILPDKIIKSSRRTMSLAIQGDGTIVVRAPSRIKEEHITKFVSQKQDWIVSKLAKIKNNQSKYGDIINYQKYLLYGNKYDLSIADVNKIEVRNQTQTILIPTKVDKDKILPALYQFYKKKAKEVLTKRLLYIKSLMRIEPKSISYSNSKGRWGACNSHGKITLNWRVIMLPPNCIDYVIVHELCHLIEMNHSSRFWNLVQTFLPNYAESRNQLKEFGFLLELYR